MACSPPRGRPPRRRRSRSRSPRPRSHHYGHGRRSPSPLRPSARQRSRSPPSRGGDRRGDATRRVPTAVVLPAAAHRAELLAAIKSHQVVVCVGETGSGKTTQLPQYLLHALQAHELLADSEAAPTATPQRCIVVTQPRRVATVAVAQRVADEMGFARLRDSPVGYAIRFDDQTTATTRLKFVTDGVLVRECLRDPTLAAYAVVVLDEAHERSLHTDILLGLLKRVLATRRDLRLLVTSATLDAERFTAFFASNENDSAPVVTIPGRVFPVDIFHSKQSQVMGLRGPLSSYVRAAVETTMQVHFSEPAGHILVFLTGQHEIEDACAQMRRLYNERRREEDESEPMELRVLPLYGALSGRAQRDIFQEVPTRVRKVIVATNIAETSLTIDGVRYVVDSGFTKQKVYNPDKQLESLVVVPISKVSAQQRAGRAGRTAPGKCFRLYSKESYEQMLDESIPEIRRTNLANTVLYLKVLGVHNVLEFELLDRPEEDALLDALEQLFVLDAIDSDGHVTTMGKLMAQFPLEPKLSRALIEAIVLECENDMTTIVAMLSTENIYSQPKHTKKHERDSDGDETPSQDQLMLLLAKDDLIDDRGDQLTFLRLLDAFAKLPAHRRLKWCEKRELRHRSLSTALSIRGQLLDVISSLPTEEIRILRDLHHKEAMLKRSRSTRLRRALCAGFFSQAVRRCNLQSSVYRSLTQDEENGPVQLLHLHPLSALNYVTPPSFCVYHELVLTSRPFMRNIVEVEETWVRDCARGKSKVSWAQLYALSGVKISGASAKLSHTKRKAEHEPVEQAETGGALSVPVQGDLVKQKESAVDAARSRFLARKKTRS